MSDPIAPVNQLAPGTPNPTEACQECFAAWVLAHAGIHVTVAEVESAFAAHGDNPADGSDVATLIWYLQSKNIACHEIHGDCVSQAIEAANTGHIWMLGELSDRHGSPVPPPGVGIYHVLGGPAHAFDATNGMTMQSVGGTYEPYSIASLRSASRGFGLIIDTEFNVPNPAPVPSPHPAPPPAQHISQFKFAIAWTPENGLEHQLVNGVVEGSTIDGVVVGFHAAGRGDVTADMVRQAIKHSNPEWDGNDHHVRFNWEGSV